MKRVTVKYRDDTQEEKILMMLIVEKECYANIGVVGDMIGVTPLYVALLLKDHLKYVEFRMEQEEL